MAEGDQATPTNITVDQFAEAVVTGVMRALDTRSATAGQQSPDSFPWVWFGIWVGRVFGGNVTPPMPEQASATGGQDEGAQDTKRK